MHPQLPSDFEAAVLEWIATRSGDQALQKQLARAQVIDRDYTVVGCYSTLLVPTDAPTSTAGYSSRGPLDGPHFESKAVEHGGGTLLWFEGGRASCLEIYAYGDYFPADHSQLGKFMLSSGASQAAGAEGASRRGSAANPLSGLQGMRDVPKAVDEAFYSGKRTPELPFCVNDSVEVLRGPEAGQVGAVISVETIRPEVILLVELANGRDVVIRAEELRRCEGAG